MEKKYASQEDFERAVQEAVKYGAVYAQLYFDAHAQEEETVRSSLVEFVSRLSGTRGLIYCKGEVLEVFKQPKPESEGEGDEYTSSAKVDVVADTFNTLLNVCTDFAPMAVEIMAPSSISLTVEEAQAVLLDASRASQDRAEMVYKQLLKPEQYEALSRTLKQRVEAGKKLLEQAKAERQGGLEKK